MSEPGAMTTGITGRFVLATVLIAVSGYLPAAGVTSLPKNREQAVDAFVGQFVDLAMFDGTILIDIGGDVVYDKSFGHAHIELGVRHDEQTRFRIASVSKALTDAAIAVMIGQGRFRLDTPIGRYRSSFGDFELTLGRSPEGYLLTIDDVNDAYAALIPLADGSFLQPQYFQKCAQDSATRVITCKMLSGDERYTSTLTPVANE